MTDRPIICRANYNTLATATTDNVDDERQRLITHYPGTAAIRRIIIKLSIAQEHGCRGSGAAAGAAATVAEREATTATSDGVLYVYTSNISAYHSPHTDRRSYKTGETGQTIMH